MADQLTIRRAIHGDEAALRALWVQYAPRVDAVVRRLVSDPDQAADIAQEEIATELGITSGGSKSQLFKARAKLRGLLAHLVDAPNTQDTTHVAHLS